MESRLLQDLGIDGDDAAELLEKIGDECGVDFTGFDFERHFWPESNIVNIFFGPARVRDAKIPIKVVDLVNAAGSGRWNPACGR